MDQIKSSIASCWISAPLEKKNTEVAELEKIGQQ